MKLLHKIRDFAVTHPEYTAFTASEKKLTYKELWLQSERVANYLLQKDLESGSPIMVYGHMEPEMLISFLGCVKSGHPYIPIDTSIPLDRIQKIAESSHAKLLINVCDEALKLENCEIEINHFNQFKTSSPEIFNVDPAHWVTDDENFYIIYTSGSTGTPKGVQISADNLQSFADWMVTDFPLETECCFLNQAPFSFDLSVMDLYPALISGGSIFAITKDMIAKPKLLFEALKHSSIQIWASTPSFVQMCLMDPSFNEELLPKLSVFLFCGEILPGNLADQLIKRFPHAKIFNTYGPTEATVAITSVEITKEMIQHYQNLPIGVPKEDTRVLLIDENGKEAAEGEKGEIIIVGPSVSKGYLGRRDLTDKAFFFFDGQRAYRTGDAGFIQNELLFYKGRMDFQIKLHGYRMELEEIEYHISKSKYVKAAVVVPFYQNDKIEYLTAAIVPEEHEFEKEFQLTSAIKKELGDVLPTYMIPRKFSYHDELPITANGKIDRKRIKEKVAL